MANTTETSTKYTIGVHNLESLTKTVTRLARKAEKLGLTAPSLTVVSDRYEIPFGSVFDKLLADRTEDRGAFGTYTAVDVELVGVEVRLPGWHLLGVIALDHEGEGDNLVKLIGDAVSEPHWFTAGDECEHCNRKGLGRKRLLPVENDETGDRLLVGTTCAKDFLGHANPEGLASYLEALEELTREIRLPGEPSTPTSVNSIGYLAVVGAVIDTIGWTSASKAYEFGGESTGTTAWFHVTTRGGDRELRFAIDHTLRDGYEARLEEADLAIEWAQEFDGNSDFAHNVRTVANRDYWTTDAKGLGAWILEGYRKHAAEVRTAEAAAAANPGKVSAHVGTVGERLVLTGTCVDSRPIESHYGMKYLLKFVTPDGDTLVWWCSGAACPEVGDTITGKATVKDHGTFRGVNETTVNRWSFTTMGSPSVPCGDRIAHAYSDCECPS